MATQQSSNNSSAQSSSSVSRKFALGKVEGKTPLWGYVTLLQSKQDGGGNATWRCNYCEHVFKNSYFRVKAHLLKIPNKGISVCTKVSDDCLEEMKEIDKAAIEKAKPVQVPLPTGTTSMRPPSIDDWSRKRRGLAGPLEKAFNNEARDHLSCEIARFFYSAGLPFNVARNPYFMSMLSYAANNPISGFVPPGYNAIRTTYLQREKTNIMKLLEPIINTWPQKGVSIVTDGWTDAQRRPLINFMAASDAGAMFLKADDASGECKDRNYIANKILDVIKDVGAQNVVQVITDNAPVCKTAGSIVEGVHPHIFWTPCVVHTLNLALKNICDPKNTESNEAVYRECSWISQVADDAQLIRNFIMNHSMRLAMFHQFVNLKLFAVAETRFASTIIMLKRLRVVKQGLLSMVIDEQWTSYRDDDKHRAQFVKDTILNDSWWEKVDYVLSFTSPIYDMLRACDTNQATLHLVYEKWDSMIEQVKLAIFQHENKELNQHSSFYDVVYNILIDRWTKSNTPLHCLAHSLNPRYYCEQWLEGGPNRVAPHMDSDICMERNKCLRSYFPVAKERLEAYAEIAKFTSANGELAQYDCSQHRWELEPRDWWVMYGAALPRLQPIALKLLAQPSSSSCCERNWSTYSFIHSTKRNKLNPTRANDLVFVHSNLRLLSRKSKSYMEGETKMWDVGGDAWDFEGNSILDVASLSLDEPDLEAVLFTEEGNDETNTVGV